MKHEDTLIETATVKWKVVLKEGWRVACKRSGEAVDITDEFLWTMARYIPLERRASAVFYMDEEAMKSLRRSRAKDAGRVEMAESSPMPESCCTGIPIKPL